jgi:hypothetical protein
VANYYCILTGERDNDLDLLKRGYTEKQIKALKKPDKFTNIMGLTYKQSLTKYVYHNMNYICLLLDNYEKGNLPFDGPISEQPAQCIEIINIMASVKATVTNERNKERNG